MYHIVYEIAYYFPNSKLCARLIFRIRKTKSVKFLDVTISSSEKRENFGTKMNYYPETLSEEAIQYLASL